MSGSKAVKSPGLVEYFIGDPTREYVTRYMVIDPNGDSDEVLHKSWITAVETFLDLDGIGDRLEARMREDGVRPIACNCPTSEQEEEQSEWIWSNQDLVKELMSNFGYRILDVTVPKEKK